MRGRTGAWLGVAVGLALQAVAAAADEAAWRKQIEADWLEQEQVRRQDVRESAASPREDAAGGCDGVKDGRWGFHTAHEQAPWWSVDLGEARPIQRVVIYNRCDAAARNARLIVSLSADGRQWGEVFRNNGAVFFGHTDGKPLEVALDGAQGRFVRVQLPQTEYLHLDEVEVYGADGRNLALGRPANQSSVSQWSTKKRPKDQAPALDLAVTLARGRQLAAALRETGVDVTEAERALDGIAAQADARPAGAPAETRRDLFLAARWAVRRMALANPLLDFDRILFVKRAPGRYSHMSDQFYGWWSRPGGGICILEGTKRGEPRVRCLTEGMPEGSFLRPDLSHDGTKVLFAYCRYFPHVADVANKVDKAALPEEAFYHVFEMNVDGSGLRQLTRGRYDDFDARYLPGGEIVFLSTRRGQFVQCGMESALQTTRATLPDSYVRCGGGPWRPVAVYTLHVMDAGGARLRQISPFENFEWTPSVANDGRILYMRWDYVDRNNMPYMSLWSTNPDGTNPQIVYGNFTQRPHCVFEARSVPRSNKIVFTASAHHSMTAGSLVLLDPSVGLDDEAPLTRLTPEVCFPECEGWPATYYCSPWPLSERFFLTAWSNVPIRSEGGLNPPNALGIYLYDAFGNLELLHRDEAISSLCPIPLAPRETPPVRPGGVDWEAEPEGRFLVFNVYEGLTGIERGTVKRLRVVGMPAKTQPTMNEPVMGVTKDDPGKFVIGTAPVEEDGSAHFRVPAGVPVFFQALDKDGLAIQTMRSLTYVQPGQTLACIGCHERREMPPATERPLAARRAPSKLAPPPEGAWPLRYDRLVQPVLDAHCIACHAPDSRDAAAAMWDLTAAKSYETLLHYGRPSLSEHVLARYQAGRSSAGAGAALDSPLLALLRRGHKDVRLDAASLERLTTWMDIYAQRLGSFSPEQEEKLRRLRTQWAALLEE